MTSCLARPESVVVLVHDGMALAAADHRPVDGEREWPGDRESAGDLSPRLVPIFPMRPPAAPNVRDLQHVSKLSAVL
jgi:hypothetical protein